MSIFPTALFPDYNFVITFDKIWQAKQNTIVLNHLGQKIRELREKQNLLLRQVAAQLEVDTALMSKIERGERNASKQQVIDIAKFLKANEDELLTLWLADKLESAVGEENHLATDALNILKKKLKKWRRALNL